MNLHFSLDYSTKWGEYVGVEITLNKNGGVSKLWNFNLETNDGRTWYVDAKLSAKDVSSFSYQYAIYRDGTVIRREWNVVPRLFTAVPDMNFHFVDFWRDIPASNHLYSAAYTHCVSHFEPAEPRIAYFDKTIVFRVQAPQLKKGQILALVGSQPSVGLWDANRAIRMSRAGINEWILSITSESLYLPFEYKYVILDEETSELVTWEGGDNRLCPSCTIGSNGVLVIFDQPLRVADEKWKVAGVVVPVFSLRSEQSQGVGDFSDLKRLIDWAKLCGMHAIQVLPINDTTQSHTYMDSYPYNSISIYALHPMYLDLQQLQPINDAAYLREYEKARRRLNGLQSVDYEAVCRLKEDYLRCLYKQEGRHVVEAAEFQAFCAHNEYWLIPYAAFCYLRDKYGTADFRVWPKYSVFDEDEVHALVDRKKWEVQYYIYVQYLLDKQLSGVTEYARKAEVMLKGDIPIGISRNSVEAWSEPHLFHMNGQAGAPPDDFSVTGQNWGFPTYNWEQMETDGYQWWIRRFRKMAEYFDVYRIDHVLGFFRIWEVPMHSVHALLGQFSPSLPMSVEEIENYGLHFQKTLFTRPYITQQILEAVFGDKARLVRDEYIDILKDGTYQLKKDFATQRQVEAFFAGKSDSESVMLRDGLYSLINDVLFVEDMHKQGLYHPRISVMNDYVFDVLSDSEKDAFRNLYEHYYFHRHNDFWYNQAMRKLPTLVQATSMLVCAEDLGMVPACVAPVMNQLRILSLEIQSMPKDFGVEFARVEENPYYSVSTIFTHDMPTLRSWWEENYDRTQRYYNQILQHDGAAPRILPGWLCEEVLARHLYCPSMLCLISLQDWLSLDEEVRYSNPDEERINIPSCPRHYWRYRMHLTIEELQQAESLNDRISKLILRSGR